MTPTTLPPPCEKYELIAALCARLSPSSISQCTLLFACTHLHSASRHAVVVLQHVQP
jgi:hypothetical protein